MPHLRLAFHNVVVAALALVAAGESRAEVSARGYVIHMFHPATYSQPGNCPKGGNGSERDQEREALLKLGYSPAEVQRLLEGDRAKRRRLVAMRGKIDGKPANAVTHPTSVPDPNIELASGKYAYGFDLDGKGPDQPGSFEDPETHQRGVDNNMYHVIACYPTFDMTLPKRPQASDVFWEIGLDNAQAWLFVITGKDLTKDGEVEVTFHRATTHALRDRAGRVMADATYVIDRKGRSYGRLRGEIRDGVLTVGPGELVLEGELPLVHELDLKQAHLRFKMPDDSGDRNVYGWLGGYAPWYSQWFELSQAYGHYMNEAGTYYAFRRLADADPDPQTGENRRISATFRVEATPAFVMTPDGKHVGAP